MPTNIKYLRSFLGMTYCTNFLQNLCSITHPLRELTKANVHWTLEHQHLSTFLMAAETLGQFDPKTEAHVIPDASHHGLEAIIAQRQLSGEFCQLS